MFVVQIKFKKEGKSSGQIQNLLLEENGLSLIGVQ